MSQSLTRNYIHIVFSTKGRQALIIPPIDKDLYSYLAGICKVLDCPVIIIGGHLDHIHILAMLSKKIALMTLVQKLKANSSKWIKTKGQDFQNFYWQNGYGAFSVNPKQVDAVTSYISNQKTHHQKTSFQEEYRSFLTQYKIEYDERYVWD